VVATAAKAVSGSGSVDLVVSYVRGARRSLWMAGLPHVVTYPLLPVGPFVRLMIGAVSLGGALGLGVTADQAAVPELDFLLHRIEQTAEELVRAVR
jgi:diacylglycerol O-acyltransferase